MVSDAVWCPAGCFDPGSFAVYGGEVGLPDLPVPAGAGRDDSVSDIKHSEYPAFRIWAAVYFVTDRHAGLVAGALLCQSYSFCRPNPGFDDHRIHLDQ